MQPNIGILVSVAFKPRTKDSISQQRAGEKEMHLNFHFSDSDTHPSNIQWQQFENYWTKCGDHFIQLNEQTAAFWASFNRKFRV